MSLRRIIRLLCGTAAGLALAAGVPALEAAEVQVAAAANFVPILKQLAPRFERRSGDRLLITPGSTGKLYAQITAGAPFDVFLAADARRPRRLERQGLAVRGSRFTYAVGKLVLWVRGPAAGHGLQALTDPRIHRIAIANPDVAPYGAAARQALQRAGVWRAVQVRLVYGEDIGQAFHYIAAGGADAGLVAMSQLLAYTGSKAGTSYWPVPAHDYSTLQQQAVLLQRAADNAAATAFLAFLKEPQTRAAIRGAGYGP